MGGQNPAHPQLLLPGAGRLDRLVELLRTVVPWDPIIGTEPPEGRGQTAALSGDPPPVTDPQSGCTSSEGSFLPPFWLALAFVCMP